MLLDRSNRYALTQSSPTTLWRYDARWRGISMFEPYGDSPFTVVEGVDTAIVVHQPESGGPIEATVRDPGAPERIVATGRYTDGWSFEGDMQAWSRVPEYLIVQGEAGAPALLRIADGAEIDPLDGFDSAVAVAVVPDSRLVVITGESAYTVYDPIAVRAIRHFELAGGNDRPIPKFRNGDELWINDTDTMLKMDTKQFEIVDAAGSELSAAENTADEGGAETGTSSELGRFGRWSFGRNNQLCVVTRPNIGDVLVLDGQTMLPVARGILDRARPMDAALVGRNSVVSIDEKGKARRSRLRKVTIRFED